MSLQGKVAVVTGGAQGLGRADAILLAKEGATVAVLDLKAEATEGTVDEIKSLGGEAVGFAVDVSDYNYVQETMAAVRSRFGPIGILVNNAAKMDTIASFKDTTKEMWDKDLSVNLSGAFNCTKAVWSDMLEQRFGRIVNMTSIAGLMGGFGQVCYSSAKAGITGFTKTMALEGARYNIRVNCVAPSLARTPAFNNIDPKYQERITNRIPFRRLGEPNELAEVVLFLCSERSSFVTGQIINVMGGADLFTV